MSYTHAYDLNDTNTNMLYGSFEPTPTPVSPSFVIHTITMLFVIFAPNMMFMLVQRGYNADRVIVNDNDVEELNDDVEELNDDGFANQYDHLLRLHHDVVCIGGWKSNYCDEQFEKFCSYFHPDDVSRIYCLSNEEESINMAQNAFRMFEMAYGLENTLRKTFGLYFLAIGTSREYTHFTVMNDNGEIVMNYREPGIMFYNSCVPFNAAKYNAVIENIAEYFEIGYILCYGNIHRMLEYNDETNAPIVPNNHALPEKISTTMADFAPYLGWGQGISRAKMLMVDYFQMPESQQAENCYGNTYCLSDLSITKNNNTFILGQEQFMYVDHETGVIRDENEIIGWDYDNKIIEEAAIWVANQSHIYNSIEMP